MSDFLPTECDIVMEGGVTSGVVYPTFVAGLSRRFRLRSIGGTSVGAVAAIAAAAAQFRRNKAASTDGFDKMARIPEQLQEAVAGKSRLFSLFQACPDLDRHFSVIAASLNRANKFKAFVCVVMTLITRFPLGALLGALAWGACFYTSHALINGSTAMSPSLMALLWFGLSALGCIVGGALVQMVMTAWTGLRKNRCGICSGMRQTSASPPGLTEWLHELVQNIAGLPLDTPLTFGLLNTSEPPIELALMTTGLSELRAHRLPHTSRDLVFRASELRQLFPAEVVESMIRCSDALPCSERTRKLFQAADAGRERDHYLLPLAQDLPVLVAARMSLSFPVLLQAVPLLRIREAGVGANGSAMRRIWFADGGLTSNFPIHFFDTLLPTRPTFGVTLSDDFDPAGKMEERVVLPVTNNQGVAPAYLEVEDPHGLPSPLRLAQAIFLTIRTWRDQALKRTPGYRDRVVQIHHTKKEGGLNLDMPSESIALMSESGAMAAERIIERFLCVDSQKNGWLNHRWVRMRSAAGVLQQAFKPVHGAMTQPALSPSYQDLWLAEGKAAQAAYMLDKSEREQGRLLWEQISAMGPHLHGVNLSASAPRPEPSLVISPKQS
ncbi:MULTISPECIES: patatin-like phospholipase family protein [unclassified Janthinobacterium]|uniref:patatin-like phospholipase family protein n=1 Tax=unclassified Janthinobacterium TaxID=2610881 RepID=UPI00160F435D|nr:MULTISPECIES: patatin-like phospholipase family protein [unclassified Janthinobacterium]MBB5370018.1 putative acylesterase/phospholipase RssA [Janthinobacterium sp. K2C7]MBB5382824.1 putative acylesterase/phospholipase RssA [Janthinobacterium sp. K2Li3]MBB5384809.1 putative acylesterase/phospholipase RssA [Janthinobacterium sp. K2E3]